MSIARRREEIVVFRLTDQELVSLKRVCESKGGRNLSEFARTELLSSAHAPPATRTLRDSLILLNWPDNIPE